ALDEANIVVTGGGNGPYYLIRTKDPSEVTDKILLAILNHPLSEAFVRNDTSSFRGGYYSHGKQFIEDLPIPQLTDELKARIENLVGELLTLSDARRSAKTPHALKTAERDSAAIRAQLEQEVSNAFQLDP